MIENETIFKIKKVIDSHFFVAIGKKSIPIWNSFNDFNLKNDFASVSKFNSMLFSRNLFLLNKYMGCNLFWDSQQID